MKKILGIIKKEPMLTVSVLAAVISLFITPPSLELLSDIDWRTLGTLFLMLTGSARFPWEAGLPSEIAETAASAASCSAS